MSDHQRRLGHPSQDYGRPGAPGSARLLASGLCAVALALAACGSGERTFTAQEFVDEANVNGANLALGESLSTADAGAELYALTVEPPSSGAGGPDLAAPGEGVGSGSMRVVDSTSAAEDEYARCERAGLFCYRAANVVLVFEADVAPGSLADLAHAIRAMKGD